MRCHFVKIQSLKKSNHLQILTACSLASFSLSDCVTSLLGSTLEVISPAALAEFASLGKASSKSASAGKHTFLYFDQSW